MKNIWYACVLLTVVSNSHAQTWQKITAMPGGSRDAGIAFTVGNKIYSGGGSGAGGRDFYQYDIQNKKWTKKASIPGVDTNRGFAAAFSINGKGYVGMGSDGIYVPSVKHDLWEYDPVADTWLRKSDYPGGNRDGIGVFVIGNKAYVGGGLDSGFFGDQNFYEYDPAVDKWSQKTDLPIGPIIFPSMFTIGNYGYLTCGGGFSGEFTDLWRYDAAKDSWDQMASFTGAPRQACATFALCGKGYVGLGQTGYTSAFNDMYSYDPLKDAWQKEGNFSGKARAWVTSITVADTVYIGNGASFNGGLITLNDWWSLTPVVANVNNSSTSSESHIYSYPNPAQDKLQIAGLAGEENYAVIISDILGREVGRTSFSSGVTPSLDIRDLRFGTYNVALRGGTGVTTMRFVKE